MIRFVSILTIIYFISSSNVKVSAQSNLLVLSPYSTQNEFRRSKHPKCQKLYFVEEKLKTRLSQLAARNQLAERNKLAAKGLGLQLKIKTDCQHPTDVAIKTSFSQDAVRKLVIELKKNASEINIFNYQNSKDLEEGPSQDMIIKVENFLEHIWLLYEAKENFLDEKNTNHNSDGSEIDKVFSALKEIPVTFDKTVNDVLEANKRIIDIKYRFNDIQNTVVNGKNEFKSNLLSSDDEYEKLELMFAHYYQINKISSSTANLQTHVFFVDYTQNDQNMLPTVYNRKSSPTPFKNRTTDYIGNMTKDLSMVIDEFSRRSRNRDG